MSWYYSEKIRIEKFNSPWNKQTSLNKFWPLSLPKKLYTILNPLFGIVVKVLNSQSRGPVFKSTG